jgi:small subunit ribosomal protein S6
MIEIVEDNQTKKYELTCVLAAEYTKSELDEIQAELTELLEDKGAEIDKKESWGKKDLAYTIRKEGKAYDEGYYLHWVFSVEPSQVQPIKQALNLREKIIRKLLVIAE